MTKIDHEKLNALKTSTKPEAEYTGLCAAPEQKTFRGGPIRSALVSTTVEKKDVRIACEKCGQKIIPKNMKRHLRLVHDDYSCPFCRETILGYKKLGRHIKKTHGYSKYRLYKSKRI